MEKNSVNTIELVIIGGSAGSFDVLLAMLPVLSTNIKFAIVIVLHRNNVQPYMLEDLFALKTKLPVKEVEDKEDIMPGIIYIAPADYHLLIEKNKTFSLDLSEKIMFCRPAINVSFETAAEAYTTHFAGVLLSGSNADGVLGLQAIKNNDGIVVVQDPSTATVSYMPQQAINNVEIDFIIEGDKLGHFLNQLSAAIN